MCTIFLPPLSLGATLSPSIHRFPLKLPINQENIVSNHSNTSRENDLKICLPTHTSWSQTI